MAGFLCKRRGAETRALACFVSVSGCNKAGVSEGKRRSRQPGAANQRLQSGSLLLTPASSLSSSNNPSAGETPALLPIVPERRLPASLAQSVYKLKRRIHLEVACPPHPPPPPRKDLERRRLKHGGAFPLAVFTVLGSICALFY